MCWNDADNPEVTKMPITSDFLTINRRLIHHPIDI